MTPKDRIESITVTVVEDEQDPDQLLLDLGLELCNRLGWHPGDTIHWQDNMDGSWTLIKKTPD
jgi:hypothetical protein